MNILKSKLCSQLLLMFLILSIQNIVIYYVYYFNGVGFPADFIKTYNAIPFFWIHAAIKGLSPDWIPFQGMGYPLYMNLQSGYYYLPFWIFVLLKIQYTISVAVVFQLLHIFFASVGAFYCARVSGLKYSSSLFVAIIYQTFGGFFSNCQHMDIVRGFAIIPWVFAIILYKKWDYNSSYFKVSLAIIPALTYLLITGSYVGIWVAVLFIFSTVLIIRAIVEKQFKILLYIIIMLVSGILLTSFFLLPVISFKSEIGRVGLLLLDNDYLQPIDVFSTVFKITYDNLLPHDPSMRSLFVGNVTMILLFLFWKNNKEYYLYYVIAIISFLMMSGVMSPIIGYFLRPLLASRFLLSDYRAIFCFVIILLSVHNFEKFYQIKIRLDRMICYFIFLSFGIGALKLLVSKNYIDVIYILIISVAIFSVIYLCQKKYILLVTLLSIISCIDNYRVNYNQYYDTFPNIKEFIEHNYGTYNQIYDKLNHALLPSDLRPARISESGDQPKTFMGYYTGDFMMYDYSGPMQLSQYHNILESANLRSFAKESWTYINLSNKSLNSSDTLSLITYSMNDVYLQVNSSSAINIVENEIYWKGWEGTISSDHSIIYPYNYNGFRAWDLPPGSYTLHEHFRVITKSSSIIICLCGLFIWIVMLIILFKENKKANNIL